MKKSPTYKDLDFNEKHTVGEFLVQCALIENSKPSKLFDLLIYSSTLSPAPKRFDNATQAV